MRRHLIQSSLILVVMMMPMSAASGGPPGTFEYSENGRGIAHSDASIEVRPGESIVMQTFALEPGFNGLWPTHPGDTLVLVTRGTLKTYLNCTEEEVWEAGHVYYRLAAQPGHANTLVKNEGKEPAELVVAFFDVPADHAAGTVPWGAPAAGECAPRGTFSPTEQGRVLAYDKDRVEMEAGKKVIVQSFVVEPGFNFWWHKHPGPTIVLQNRGTITEYTSCTERELWEPGYAYVHTPGHHGRDQETAKNEGKETAEFIVFFFNVPEWHPAPLVPRDMQPPPSECPTASLY